MNEDETIELDITAQMSKPEQDYFPLLGLSPSEKRLIKVTALFTSLILCGSLIVAFYPRPDKPKPSVGVSVGQSIPDPEEPPSTTSEVSIPLTTVSAPTTFSGPTLVPTTRSTRSLSKQTTTEQVRRTVCR